MEKLIDALKSSPCTVAMTGAGISTLCGIPDFRGPQGLYKQPDAERIFDIDWFDRDPSIYYRGARELVYGLRQFQPGPVHRALKHLAEERDVWLVGSATLTARHLCTGVEHRADLLERLFVAAAAAVVVHARAVYFPHV